MSAPIYDKLKEYTKSGQYPFHMPGHKGGRAGAFPEISSMDITEIEGFDNLHQPEGIIAEAQGLCAKTFGAEESFFMVNGSTGGLLAAILSVCGDGAELLVARNCHRSVYSALVLSGAKPIYFMPEQLQNWGVFGGVDVEKLKDKIQENPKAKAVVLTSPTYEGFTSDLTAIAKVVHENGMILIVDEAHGAHMKFHSFFPKTALEANADLVIQSLHKTLPSLTQTAVIHVQGKQVDRERLRQALAMVQTSSPSYLFLAGMDFCRQWLDSRGDREFSLYVQRLMAFRKEMQPLHTITLLGKEVCGQAAIQDMDLGKLDFFLGQNSYCGTELGQELLKEYGIQVELWGAGHIIAMTSPGDDDEGFRRLANAMKEIDKRLGQEPPKEKVSVGYELPTARLSPRKAFFAKKETILMAKSIGRVCGEFMIPYPPGAPLLVPGEIMTEELLQKMTFYREKGISFVGCKDPSLHIITVVDET